MLQALLLKAVMVLQLPLAIAGHVSALQVSCRQRCRSPSVFSCRQTSSCHSLPAVAGQTMVDHCLMGMNSSLFAYGQTGAGEHACGTTDIHTVRGFWFVPELTDCHCLAKCSQANSNSYPGRALLVASVPWHAVSLGRCKAVVMCVRVPAGKTFTVMGKMQEGEDTEVRHQQGMQQ